MSEVTEVIEPSSAKQATEKPPLRFVKGAHYPGATATTEIAVLDEPGAGNANHQYRISLLSLSGEKPGITGTGAVINFQHGPISEVGVNGVTNEDLLAIVIDRLNGFQAGPFACAENETAIANVSAALQWLHHRTGQRLKRGVEGTLQN